MNDSKIIIDEDVIQDQAKCCIGRKLTSEECEEAFDTILEGLAEFVYYKIDEVMDIRETVKKNKNAGKTLPHYKVYYKKTYLEGEQQFEEEAVFKNRGDARRFVHYNSFSGIWKIILFAKNGSEREVYKISY